MAFNGSGTFNRVHNWVVDLGNSVKITASRMDAEQDGIATGLSNCIVKDGQTIITANIPMNTKKFTGLNIGNARTDSINLGQVQDSTYQFLGENGGSADAYTFSPSPAIPAYVAGQQWLVKIGSGDDNTTASTANISGLGVRAIEKSDGAGGTTALESDDMVAGSFYELKDTGTLLILSNPEKPFVDSVNITNINGLLKSVQTFTSSGTWTKPAGITAVMVEVVGGGGGGGGGGTGTGSAGGNSSFGSFLSGAGGAGGALGNGNGSGGTGGNGSGGDINIKGGDGGSGADSGADSNPTGGVGGSSFFGGGGRGGRSSSGDGANGTTGGSGGGGGAESGADNAGGGGAGGGYSREFINSGLGSTETITVGGGGAGGVDSGEGGGDGGGGLIIVTEYS